MGGHWLDDVQLVTAQQKVELQLARSKVLEWGVFHLRDLVFQTKKWPPRVTPYKKLAWVRYSFIYKFL